MYITFSTIEPCVECSPKASKMRKAFYLFNLRLWPVTLLIF